MNRKKKVLIILVVLIAVLGISGVNMAIKNKKPNGVVVQTTPIVREDIESHILTTGTIFSMDKRDIISDVEEKIEKIYVQEGDKVEKDQILMKLEDSDILYRIKDSKLRLEIEKEGLKKLENEGTKEFEIQLSNAKIRYEDAKNTYERNIKLYDEGIINKVEFDKSKDDVDQLYNDFLLAEEKLKNSNPENEIIIQKQKIELAKIETEKLEKELEKYTIKSPISGTIVDTNISESGIVQSHVALMSIQDLEHLEIIVDINEYDASKIKEGDSVKITGDSFEDRVYEGKVKYVGSIAKTLEQIQSKENVVEIKIAIKDNDEFLKPGFSAKIDILTQKKADALSLPYEAIFTKKDGEKVIFTVSDDGIVKENTIKTGIGSDFSIEVIGDIKEGNSVIMNPTEGIKDGSQVIVDKVM
ncbi:efflux RND transporter periplasmic adaptor subunit [Paratissierella segnis]|jgi:RND family efflux transporter MFP subunit|uniref:Efflux RND transporter periplasmic adaptor subunit n=1 Tax=Paratissierella segnis TaxID=2763679 RepID=A0A926EV81_9FIRM|nr:efflux RND transporter periplasmic adaptor subunit [Paratissierella segnis]MBC8589130.1 efflux RND transporter periplasmic adaptor subunit [Paratissierella segnis]